MTEEEIKNLIQQTIDQNSTSNQFAVSDTPFHTHNGSDSMALKFTRMFDVPTSYYQQAGKSVLVNSTETGLIFGTVQSGYGGIVASNGTAVKLLSGWSSSRGGTGQYTVTHNLGLATNSYAVTVTPLYDAGAIPKLDNINANSFDVNIIAQSGGSLEDSAFAFILLPIN